MITELALSSLWCNLTRPFHNAADPLSDDGPVCRVAWCPGPEANRHGINPRDFKSRLYNKAQQGTTVNQRFRCCALRRKVAFSCAECAKSVPREVDVLDGALPHLAPAPVTSPLR